MRHRLTIAATAALLLATASPATADDRLKAAEHFALAESAEKRSDWQRAIAEYQLAYELSPHPSVLYNIAVNHERLGAAREAVTYFLRYLDESEEAEDRDAVLERVRTLREQPSKVRFESAQPGATIVVDDSAVGTAPVEIELAAGRHRAHAEKDGQRSPPRDLILEYGEAVTLRFDVQAMPGLLTVDSNVAGAQVRIDGQPAGQTPLQLRLASGEHEVEVRMPGYQPTTRSINVPSQGSEQIRANLEPLAGSVTTQQPPELPEKKKIFVATGYGLQSDALRFILGVGVRTPGDRVDAAGFYGSFGPHVGVGFGAELRFFLSTGTLRPFLRAGAVLAGGGGSSDRAIALEGGGGLLYATDRDNTMVASFGIDYYIEVEAQYIVTDLDEEDASKLSVPFLGGILLRF